ncbi:MAG: NfeD family protein [bacterium]
MGTLLTIYWVLFLLGLGFALIAGLSMGLSEIAGGGTDFGGGDTDMGGADGFHMDTGGADMHGGDMDLSSSNVFHGQGEIALHPVSPMTIFSFIGGFGGGGLIGAYAGLNSWLSVLIALPVGFVIAFSLYFLMYKINQSNVSSESRVSEVIGSTGELITPIVGDATGEIAYVSRESRYVAPARSIDGKSIAKGRPVKIWRIVGSTCFVKEILPEEAEQPGKDILDNPDRK